MMRNFSFAAGFPDDFFGSAALFAGLWICVVFMQPFDLVYLLTYSYGYYTSKDLIAFGAIPTVVLLALSVIWIPAICAVL